MLYFLPAVFSLNIGSSDRSTVIALAIVLPTVLIIIAVIVLINIIPLWFKVRPECDLRTYVNLRKLFFDTEAQKDNQIPVYPNYCIHSYNSSCHRRLQYD